jgi:heme exporter protein D
MCPKPIASTTVPVKREATVCLSVCLSLTLCLWSAACLPVYLFVLEQLFHQLEQRFTVLQQENQKLQQQYQLQVTKTERLGTCCHLVYCQPRLVVAMRY